MHWTKHDYEKWLSEGSPVNPDVTELNISFDDLTTLVPVNNLPNLQKLICSHNKIVDIQGLQLPNLQELDCSSNQIVDIQGLQLPNLQSLSCYNNQIVDIQGLQLPNLQTLYCSSNQIVDIQGLQVPNLQTLYCSHNQIVDIQGLQLPNLQALSCDQNQIVDIQGLQLPNLQTLNCPHNRIVDIQGLQLPNLQKLYCLRNQIVDIQGIQLPNLQTLRCGYNQIVDIQGLQLPNLRTLNCGGNQIVSIQGLQLPNLHKLHCKYNQIVDIQGLQLPNLQELHCQNNQITNLSFLYPMPYLRRIYYSDNPIEYIAPNIQRLLTRSNQRQNVYTDTQNVHNHHIQESIRNSIRQVMSIQPTITNLSDFIIQDGDLSELTKSLLLGYMDDETVHSTLDVSFSELLLNVLSLVESNEHRKEIKTILNQEMNDAQCKCYTGRMSRLVNCLNGYTDCVQIQISDAEQIGYVVQLVRHDLETSNEYSVDRHKELVRLELLDRHYSESVITEWVDYIE
jgi:Leucine-rich repeat (LRR) protein